MKWKKILDKILKWASLEAETRESSGYEALVSYYSKASKDFHELGRDLVIWGEMLKRRASVTDVQKYITSDPDKTLENLMKNFIIFHKVPLDDPKKISRN